MKEFSLTQAIAQARATRDIGYNNRAEYHTNTSDYFSNYYFTYRELEFHRFKITLRATILQTINEGIDRAEKQLGDLGRLTMEGAPTIEDIEHAHYNLQTGSKTYREIMRPFRHW